MMYNTDIPEEYKKRIRDKFELAAEKSKWLINGGKIIVEIDRPKPGKIRLVKVLTIIETINEI